MTKFTCPSCGAEIIFRSSISTYAVCGSCGSTVVRRDVNIEAIGKMAELPPDISPLQIGTELTFNKHHFIIAGRARMAWTDGAWNEWFLVSDKGSPAWLAEAQGFFAISVEEQEAADGSEGLHLPARSSLAEINSVWMLHGIEYRVSDIKEAVCAGSEGELPFAGAKGRRATYVDLVGSTARFASIEYSPEGQRCYTGSYVEFEDLNFSNLRDLDGWKKPAHAAHDPLDPRSPSAADS